MRAAREEGREEGREAALAAMVTKLIIRRFGPLNAVNQARLRQATVEQLEALTDRILVATDLEAVFRHP